jgi:predicted CoA-binding protein
VIRAEEILRAAESVLVVDWPSRDVPDTLARCGYTVVVHGGPGPEDFSAYALRDGEVVVSRSGGPPEHADLVYSHRPLDELPEIVETARRLGATAVWAQSGLDRTGARDPKGCWRPDGESQRARAIVEEAGLAYVDDTYIADEVRSLGIQT